MRVFFFSSGRQRLLTLLVAGLFAAIAMPARAVDFMYLATQDQGGQILFGALAGMLATAACYLFFIWLAIRDRSQIFLIVMLLALLVGLGLSTDQSFSSVYLASANFLQFMRGTALLVFYAASCFFTLHFLETSTYSRGMAMAVQATIVGLGVCFLLLATNTVFISDRMVIVGLAVCCILLLAGLKGLLNGIPGSGTQMLAFTLLLFGSAGGPMAEWGLLPSGLGGSNLFYLASGAAALVFALGIARQFSSRQEEKERQLSLSNERFALAALGSNEGLFDWDVENKTVFFADRFKKLVGRELEPNEDGLEQWMQLIDPVQQDRVRRDLSRFRDGEAVTIALDYRVRRPDGRLRWLYTSGVALRDPKTGKMRRLVGSTGDITERKQAEFALKESESRFRSITEAHPVPVVIIGLDDASFMYASPSVMELLGTPPQELLGHSAESYFADRAVLKTLISDLLRGSVIDSREVMMTALGGSEQLPVAISARMIDYQKRTAAVIGLEDLRASVEAQAQIEQQRIALEQSEKLAALGSLLAGVAHELNNPLSIVVGQSTLLLEGSSDPKTQARADKIKHAAERCTRIVRNFLALARRKDPERRPVDLAQVVNQVFELISPQLRSDAVEAKIELAPHLPQVMADVDQLHQILTNLVLNAKQALMELPDAHFTAKGEPRKIDVTTQIGETPDTVMLRVSDNGRGVPTEIRRRIFEPFFTTKKEGRGTGIGLSLSLGLAEAHGGRISYEDTPGGGATFILTLPIGAGQIAVPAPVATLPSGRQLSILLVDDEPDVMQILADLLGRDNHAITQAEHGADALEKLRNADFDLVISDLRMPVMDGPTLYRTITADVPRYANRIFFVTGDTLSPHVRSFLEENPVLVIDKPYMPEDVRQAVARQLRIAESWIVKDTAKIDKVETVDG